MSTIKMNGAFHSIDYCIISVGVLSMMGYQVEAAFSAACSGVGMLLAALGHLKAGNRSKKQTISTLS